MNREDFWRRLIVLFIGYVLFALVVVWINDNVMADTVYVTAESGLRVRSGPSTKSDVVRVLPFGEEVEAEGNGKWLKIEDGYIYGKYVDTESPIDGEYMGVWRITAYAATGNVCANGAWPTTGHTIAHNSLPFGTRVYIEGVGERVVEDRGPTSLGDAWCDVYMGDTATCIQWGDQQRKVWKLS